MKKYVPDFLRLASLTLALFIYNLAGAQYCTPTYTSSQCVNYNMYVQDFVTTGGVANITNTSSGCGNTSTSYKFYSTKKHAGVQGTQVSFTVKIGASYPQGVRIYVDYNIDGDFDDAGENVWTSNGTISANGSATGNFTIPANATPGNSRIRVRCSYSTTSFNACNAQNYGECEDYVFEIVPSCSAKFTTDPTSTSFCENSSTILVANANNTDSYHWQLNTGSGWYDIINGPNYSGVNTDTLKIMNSTMSMQNYQYRAVATNSGEACSVNSDPATMTIIPTTKSSVVITPSTDTKICEESTVTFYTAFTNAGSAPKYQWMLNGQDIENETSATLTTSDISNNDEVQCLFTSSAVCVFPEVSNKVKFTVEPKVEPKVDIQIIYNGENSYSFKAIPENGGPNPIYQWYRENKPVVGANSDMYTPEDINEWEDIFVQMVSNEKCVDPAFNAVSSRNLTTGVHGLALNIKDLGLHPNPNSGNFHITGQFGEQFDNKTISIRITNTLGQAVYANEYNSSSSVLNIPVQMPTEAANGIYTVSLSVDGKYTTMRFMLNK